MGRPAGLAAAPPAVDGRSSNGLVIARCEPVASPAARRQVGPEKGMTTAAVVSCRSHFSYQTSAEMVQACPYLLSLRA